MSSRVSLSRHVDNWLISHELQQMERFIDLLDAAINNSQKQFNTSIEETASTMSEDEKVDFYEAYTDDFIELNADFPRLLFSSFIVSWYSLIEKHLISFCKSRKLKISISIEDKEHYGEGIKRAQKFLYRAAGYKIDSKHWVELNLIRELRNIIVHNQGRVSYSPFDAFPKGILVKLDEDATVYLQIDGELYNYLKKHNLLESRGLFYITPTPRYCRYLVKFGHEFFEKLYKDFRK